jgi:hypothetical protein
LIHPGTATPDLELLGGEIKLFDDPDISIENVGGDTPTVWFDKTDEDGFSYDTLGDSFFFQIGGNEIVAFDASTIELKKPIDVTGQGEFSEWVAISKGLRVGFGGTAEDDACAVGDANFKMLLAGTQARLQFDVGDSIEFERLGTNGRMDFNVGATRLSIDPDNSKIQANLDFHGGDLFFDSGTFKDQTITPVSQAEIARRHQYNLIMAWGRLGASGTSNLSIATEHYNIVSTLRTGVGTHEINFDEDIHEDSVVLVNASSLSWIVNGVMFSGGAKAIVKIRDDAGTLIDPTGSLEFAVIGRAETFPT